MFQLTMSHIHDTSPADRWDSDACVPGIEDGLVALQSFAAYVQRLSVDYGVEFIVTADRYKKSSPLIIAAEAKFDSMRGPSTVRVELQKMEPKTDVERIVDLMRLTAHFTTQISPES